MSRPSDGFTLDELRDEFDWMIEFQSRMAERIREDADVYSLVDYVRKLESENAELRKLVKKLIKVIRFHGGWYELWVDAARELGVEVNA